MYRAAIRPSFHEHCEQRSRLRVRQANARTHRESIARVAGDDGRSESA